MSPCWPATNPLPSSACMWSVQGLVLRSGDSHSMTPLKGNSPPPPVFANIYSGPPRFLSIIRQGQFDRRLRGRAAPIGQEKLLPNPLIRFPISECASRQAGLTHQHDIVQPRFSRLSQSNENFNSTSLSCFFSYVHGGHKLK